VQGSGTPVVLVHGFMSEHRSTWVRPGILKRLAARYQVIALDCRGHGASGKPHEPEAYGPEIANDLLRLLDHLGIDRAHMVGYSMGAHAVAQLLVRTPDRLITGTLGGAAGRLEWSDEDEQLAELESREIEVGTLRSQILRLTPPGVRVPDESEIKTQSRAAFAGNDRTALAAIRRANRNEVVSESDLALVVVPVLGVVGRLDPYAPTFTRLARVMRTLRVVVVEGATHRTAAGRPEFIQAVESFLAAHPAAP
jgi:pimeloyl-ACP methyl ester carboxylesterase